MTPTNDPVGSPADTDTVGSTADPVGSTAEINAITFRVTDMAASVAFYTALGLEVTFGGADAAFTSIRIGTNFVNLSGREGSPAGPWGRVVFHVADPDAVWQIAVDAGYTPSTEPADAPWHERYFHIFDPDGHELSFARPI